MSTVYLAAILGAIQAAEYSIDNAKVRKFLSYAKISVIFLGVGISMGRAGL